MKIFDGNKEKKKILFSLKEKIRKTGGEPRLAIVSVGDNKASKLYTKLKKEAGRLAGIKVSEYNFKNNSKQSQIIEKIEKLNRNTKVHGIIVQLPLPRKFNTDKIIGTISSEKDVDGFKEDSQFSPVLPVAILYALKKSRKAKEGRKALAVVNSDIFAKKLVGFLIEKTGIEVNPIIMPKFGRPTKLKEQLKKADIIITACGIPGLIKGELIKKGAVLIDAGIVRLPGKKVVGDAERESVKEKVSFLTPVPGGIGPITVALLLNNTYLAFKKYGKNKHQ